MDWKMCVYVFVDQYGLGYAPRIPGSDTPRMYIKEGKLPHFIPLGEVTDNIRNIEFALNAFNKKIDLETPYEFRKPSM